MFSPYALTFSIVPIVHWASQTYSIQNLRRYAWTTFLISADLHFSPRLAQHLARALFNSEYRLGAGVVPLTSKYHNYSIVSWKRRRAVRVSCQGRRCAEMSQIKNTRGRNTRERGRCRWRSAKEKKSKPGETGAQSEEWIFTPSNPTSLATGTLG